MNRDRGSAGQGVVVRLGLSVLVFAAAGWLLMNRQYVLDQVAVWSYEPTQEVDRLAAVTNMSEEAEFYFFASQPELQARDEFNTSCQSVQSEKTAVLGCYASQRIYLYDIDNPRLSGVVEVTAAHEMLHAAYDRLDEAERRHVDQLIEKAADNIRDPDLAELLQEYAKTEPTERVNELHSILGTQFRDVGDDLEAYYARYFDNRSALVKMYEDYRAVFKNLEKQQRDLVTQLDSLAVEINNLTTAYNRATEAYAADVAAYNSRQYSSQSAANSDRQALLARQGELAQQRARIIELRNQYERLRQQLRELNLQSVELNQSINSNLTPVEEVE